MKIVLFLFITLLTVNIFGQSDRVQVVETAVGIEKIYLAKDDGGKAGEETEVFSTTDIPIYCIVHLDSMKPTVVKINFIAVKVQGVKPETKVISTSFKTDGNQDQVNFTGKPERVWTAGNYRIDVFVDGKPAGNKEFEIRKAPGEIPDPIPVKNFVQPKLKPKPASRAKKQPFLKN